jgi:hypothetical protein
MRVPHLKVAVRTIDVTNKSMNKSNKKTPSAVSLTVKDIRQDVEINDLVEMIKN